MRKLSVLERDGKARARRRPRKVLVRGRKIQQPNPIAIRRGYQKARKLRWL